MIAFVQLDGLMIANMACNYACTGISTNDASTEEIGFGLGASSAKPSGGGVPVNIIPRDGGNRFSGYAFFNYANSGLQGNNVDEELRAQGITTADSIKHINDTSFAVGGPIKRDQAMVLDRASFLGLRADPHQYLLREESARLRVRTRSQPAGPETQENGSIDLRLTWQISPKNKLSVLLQFRAQEHQSLDALAARFSPTHRTSRIFRSIISRP